MPKNLGLYNENLSVPRKQDIDTVASRVNTNEDNIAMLDTDMEAAQGDITTLKGNVTTLTNALGSKQDKIVGGASTITDDNLTASRALVSSASGKVAASDITATELGYLDGVTSNVQTQLDSKAIDDNVVHKTGDESISGVKTFNAPEKVAGEEQTTTKFKTSNGGAVIIGKEGSNNGTMLRLDQVDGTARLRFRESAAAGSMIWEQTEQVDKLYIDLGAHGVDYHRIAFPTSGYGTLAFQSSVDDKVPKSRKINGHALSTNIDLTASDVGAVATGDVTQTLGTSTTKVPSEKAVADALSGAGAGDMLKATYDPTGSVEQAGGIPDYVAGQLPTVNDATLTIQKNGTAVGTFTANASANKSINITMAKGDVGLSNVDNVKQYSTSNPPPYPVTSVNGETGDVVIEAGGGTTIVLSGSQPTGLKAGDYWYQIVT